MKKQAWIKTGLLNPVKVPRNRVALRMKKDRANGFKHKKTISKDGFIVYQSNDRYNPYLYAVK